MEDSIARRDAVIGWGARRLRGSQRRVFQAEVATARGGGRVRHPGRRFGGGRDTVATGGHDLRHGGRCLENLAAGGRNRSEPKDPQ